MKTIKFLFAIFTVSLLVLVFACEEKTEQPKNGSSTKADDNDDDLDVDDQGQVTLF